VERAVSDQGSIDDLVLHLEICDQINETSAAAEDAAKTLRKKLASGKLSQAQILKALVVLETAVKNCHKRFHLQVTSKDFVNVLMKTYHARGQATVVKDKILELIASWARAFRSDPMMSAVVNTHQELLIQGVEFPEENPDEMAPIVTPGVSVAASELSNSHAQSQQYSSSLPGTANSLTSDHDIMGDEELARQLVRQNF
ncbi:uncharacterized protein MONBRDRAFT_13859, partial [Monosiga brevicollis MX1]